MAYTTRLNPPQINSKLPAFYGTTMKIPFVLNKAVSAVQFKGVAVIVKTVSTNNTVFSAQTSSYSYDYEKHCYTAIFDIENKFTPKVGQHYKVSIACVGTDNVVGFYSTTGVIKYTTKPYVAILDRDDTVNNTYEYTGIYSQNGIGYDASEKVYSYCFNLYNSDNVLVASSDEQIHNSAADTEIGTSVDTWTIRKALEPNVSYSIEYIVTTMNGLTVSSPRYEIIEVQFEEPSVHAYLSATSRPDDGYIEVSLVGYKDNSYVSGYCILLRSSSEDNYDSWNEITRFQLSRWDTNTVLQLCKDHTVAQGFAYRYAIQAYNATGTYSNRMLNIEGDVSCDFEDAFLWDGERQLKLRFNPKITGFKSSVLETKTNTIGSKYPFIFRNGNVEYKEFSISGLLSLLSDENDEFLTGLQEKKDNRDTTPAAAGHVADQGSQLSADNFRKERQFKLDALAWLNNGKPKLFRSAAEGNYIVRLMNVSLTPNDTLGRMLHTFNCQACEVADYTFENSQSFGFTPASYVETRSLQFAQIRDWTNLPISASQHNERTIKLPSVCMASITDAIGLRVLATFADYTTKELEFSGTYIFNEEVLKSNPLIYLSRLSNTWGGASLTYAYYDTALDSFSFITKITTHDKIIQKIGKAKVNIIEELEDIRTRTGAFHYIRVQARQQIPVYLRNGNYYLNHNDEKIVDFNPICIYPIIDVTNGKSSTYLDGRDGVTKVYELKNLSYNFTINGSSIIDFNLSNDPKTGSRFEALTNIGSISEMYAGDGIILDMVYQENEIVYAVETPGNEEFSESVYQSKQLWLSAKNTYETALSNSSSTEERINSLKAQMDQLYNTYVSRLKVEINRVKEDHNVDFAI